MDRRKSPYTAALLLALLVVPGAGGATHPGSKEDPGERIPTDRVQSEDDAGPETLDRAELVRRVLERNPEIAAARSAWRAALERVPQAGSLGDPRASYSMAPLAVGSSEVRSGDVVRIGQAIPFPGKLDLREQVASAEAAAAERRIEEVRLHLGTMAALLWDDYWLVERAREINEEHLDLLESFQRVATDRYAAGLVPQQAPLQAEVEAAHLVHEEVVLNARRRILTARINALLHRRPEEPLPPPSPDPTEETGVRPSDDLVLEALETTALEARPELLARAAEIESRKARVELEKLERRPDFEVTGSYNSMWARSEHRWMVGVGVDLPIWRKRIRAGIAEAEAELAAVRSELDRAADRVREEVAVALVSLREARHVVELYRNRVLPAARDQIQAARSGFETGANGMLSLIDAERSLRTAELEHHEAMAEVASRRTELDRALGRLPFPEARGDASSETISNQTETDR